MAKSYRLGGACLYNVVRAFLREFNYGTNFHGIRARERVIAIERTRVRIKSR